VLGEDNGPGVGGTLCLNHLDDLGNHIPCAAYDHCIADAHIEALNLVTVVEGGIAHCHAADKNRFQARHGSHCTGATDLEFHIEQTGGHFLGRKFARDGPARGAGNKAQALLQGQVVDLVDNPVDIVIEAVAALGQALVIGKAAIDILCHLHQRVDGKTPTAQLLQHQIVLSG